MHSAEFCTPPRAGRAGLHRIGSSLFQDAFRQQLASNSARFQAALTREIELKRSFKFEVLSHVIVS